MLDTETMGKEFGLSGSEQNGDLTGKDLGLLAGRLRPGPTPEVQAFADYGVDFLTADTVSELAAKMNQLVGEHLIDADALRAVIEQRDLQVRSGLGKDPQVVAIAAARKFVGDRLMRIANPHELLDPRRPGAGQAGSGGPLVAVRLHVVTRKTLGGLETDLDGRVLRADGSPGARACTRWARRPASAAAACTATAPWRAPSSAAACSPAGPPAEPSPPPSERPGWRIEPAPPPGRTLSRAGAPLMQSGAP